MDRKTVAENKAWYTLQVRPLSIPRIWGDLFTFVFLFAILFREIITQLQSWNGVARSGIVCSACVVSRDGLVLSTSRMKFCVASIKAVFAWFSDCVWRIYYAYSCFLLCTTSPLSEHSVVIVVALLVSCILRPHVCVAHVGKLAPVVV